uniref:(northern house mosquito) hypothetical protein n=1 Tax=Culex pipiens TaxID=7175 RepID=A0A8D8AFD9_CULPI
MFRRENQDGLPGVLGVDQIYLDCRAAYFAETDDNILQAVKLLLNVQMLKVVSGSVERRHHADHLNLQRTTRGRQLIDTRSLWSVHLNARFLLGNDGKSTHKKVHKHEHRAVHLIHLRLTCDVLQKFQHYVGQPQQRLEIVVQKA